MDEKKIYAEFVNEMGKCEHRHEDTYAMLLDIQYETSKIRQKYGINSYQLFEIIDRNRNAN
jgi:hypothetical protein